MKRNTIIVIGILFLTVAALALFIYQPRKKSKPFADEQEKKLVSAIYQTAQNELPQRHEELKKLLAAPAKDIKKIEGLKEYIGSLENIGFLEKKDFDSLNRVDPKILAREHAVKISPETLGETDKRFVSVIVGGDSIIPMIIFSASLDQTEQDKKRSYEILKMVLEKGISAKSKAIFIYWIKDIPGDEKAYDFVAETPSLELAINNLVDIKLIELLLNHGAVYYKDFMNKLLEELSKLNPNYSKQVKKLLEHYAPLDQ